MGFVGRWCLSWGWRSSGSGLTPSGLGVTKVSDAEFRGCSGKVKLGCDFENTFLGSPEIANNRGFSRLPWDLWHRQNHPLRLLAVVVVSGVSVTVCLLWCGVTSSSLGRRHGDEQEGEGLAVPPRPDTAGGAQGLDARRPQAVRVTADPCLRPQS